MKTKFGITGTQLKYIGLVLMVFDHIHQMFYYAGAPIWLTMLGRLVFPIFLFMLAEGFHYTRSKEKYMFRLLMGFWLMNIGSIIIQTIFPLEEVVLMNNVFGTMLVAAMLMYAVDMIKNKQYIKAALIIILPLIPLLLMLLFIESVPLLGVMAVMIFPSYTTVEGGVLLLILGLMFYLFREKRIIQYLMIAIAALISTNFNFTELFSSNFQWMMVFSIIPISFYNGQRGKGSKYFFYIFYPAHIYILYILSYLYKNFFLR